MSNTKLFAEFDKFDDEKLRDILRQFKLPCSGRRSLLLKRLASAVRQGKIPGFEFPIVMESRSDSSESLAVGNADSLFPPVPNSEESEFDVPDGFVPLHLRQETFNLINNVVKRDAVDKQIPFNGAISKSSRQIKPG